MLSVCMLAVLGGRSVAHADGARDATHDATYEAVIGEAVAQFTAAHWSEARALFMRAHELRPSARTLRGLGVVEFELGHYAAAYRLLGRALSDPRRPLAPAQRAEAQRVREHLRPLVAEYRIFTTPRDARLSVDGAQVEREPDGMLVLATGEHTLTAGAAGYVSREERVVVRGGEARDLAFVLLTERMPLPVEAVDAPAPAPISAPPAPRARSQQPRGVVPSRAWAWTTLGAGGAVTVLGATLLALGARDVATVEQAEDGTRWSSLRGAHARAPLLTGAGIGVTALGLGGAALGVWMLRRGKYAERAPVRLGVAPQGLLLSGAF